MCKVVQLFFDIMTGREAQVIAENREDNVVSGLVEDVLTGVIVRAEGADPDLTEPIDWIDLEDLAIEAAIEKNPSSPVDGDR